MNYIFFIAFCFVLPLHARPASGFYTNPEVDELRIELDDLKHALNVAVIEMNLLDERFRKQDKPKNTEVATLSLLSTNLSSLEKKVTHLEKTLDKVAGDLRTLNTSLSHSLTKIQNLEHSLSSHDTRLEEVTKLKGTLTSISKAIGKEPSPSSSKSYCVKAGDSLEKIARNNGVSVDALQKINHLANDKIFVGQELRLPHEP